MPQAIFHFHNELNEFLSNDNKWNNIHVAFNGHETVKHLLETLVVPHTEDDIILVHGVSVYFAERLQDGDRVDVFPGSAQLENTSIIHLQPETIGESRFVADGHLGKLVSYLRLLGFDVLYRNNCDDEMLAEISSNQDRILLTRDRGLLKRSQVRFGYCVMAKAPQDQVVEVLRRFDISDKAQLFSRCARCNGSLNPVEKMEIFDRLEPKTKQYYDEFHICERCNQIYWKGSHFDHMESQLQRFLRISRLD
ncbi:MAG: Mut7-C RNAse domain-containing protein [Anaerolineales bacterium]